ncbi:MAG: hypothetical protein ACKOSO_01645, partial [Actinomycetota bacterium]
MSLLIAYADLHEDALVGPLLDLVEAVASQQARRVAVGELADPRELAAGEGDARIVGGHAVARRDGERPLGG